jgi:spore germination protein GerM
MEVLMSKDTNKDSSLYFLEENLATYPHCFIFPKFHPFNKVFIKKINQLISSGLVEKLANTEVFKLEKKQNDEQQPRPLTMDHVGVCFVAIMICLGLSFVVFTVEYLIKYFVN